MSELRLYIVVDLETLDSVIPDDICEMLGYKLGSILRDKVLSIEELTHDLFLISVNLKAPNKNCAWSGLTDEQLKKAEENFGKSNLLTREQCVNLPRKIFEQ
jgi:hypothetical protein